MRKNVMFHGGYVERWMRKQSKAIFWLVHKDKHKSKIPQPRTKRKPKRSRRNRSGSRHGPCRKRTACLAARTAGCKRSDTQKQDQCKSTRWELHLNVNSIISKNNWMHKPQFLYLSLSLHTSIHEEYFQRWTIFASLHTSKMLFFEK